MDKDTLIKAFVDQFGYGGDAAMNEDFRRAVEELISQVCAEPAKLVQMIDPEPDNPRPRKIILREED